MALHRHLTLELLEHFWAQTPRLHKRKNIVFEVSTYGAAKPPYSLIVCTENIGKTWADAKRKRQGSQLDGYFSYEYDGWQFAKDLDGESLELTAEILGASLAETLEVFGAFARQHGFAHMKPLGFYDKQQCIFHVWMGEEVGEDTQTPLRLLDSWQKEIEKELLVLARKQKAPLQNVLLYFSAEDWRFEGFYLNVPALESEVMSSYPSTEGAKEVLVDDSGATGVGTPLAMGWRQVPLDALNAWLPFLKASNLKAIDEDALWKYQQALGTRIVHLLAARLERQLPAASRKFAASLKVVPMVHDSAVDKAEFQRARTIAPEAEADYLLRG